ARRGGVTPSSPFSLERGNHNFLSPLVREYQRLATSLVIAIPRFDWASLNVLLRSQERPGLLKDRPHLSIAKARIEEMLSAAPPYLQYGLLPCDLSPLSAIAVAQ